ncbi:hypothetical protein SAMN02910358_00207 [Lachnospiraceae bacterium XBB1006]|nr:hypothetical protein SAMN02910358_00207 [Lachnospiraceae bacterium XBB1006]
MNLYERMTLRDKGKLLLMWMVTVVGNMVLNWYHRMDVTHSIVSGFFGILFFLSFAFLMVHEFTLVESKKHLHDTIQRIFWVYCAAFAFVLAGYCFPYRVHVFLAVSGICCTLISPLYGLLLSLFLGVMVGMNLFLTEYELGYVICLCIMGAMISPMLTKKHLRRMVAILMGVMALTASLLFGYAKDGSVTQDALVSGVLEGVCNALWIAVGLPLSFKKKKQLEITGYEKAMESDFPLASFMRSISEARYVRCQFVAKVCALCALQLAFDEKLCACAGFYYDLCDNDEPDSIEYATNLGKSNLLPIEVVRIMSQFHGEENPIRTREAALVDLVYETVRSLEVLPKEAGGFEKEMAVHTVFNDLSKNGRYDVSGLSMNQYLTLRNYLIREVEHL